VSEEWGGGRVLLLPNGFVLKPLQTDYEVGKRALIGRFHGAIVLERPDKSTFDLSKPGTIRPGDRWTGPTTTGLECAMQSDGSLACSWYHPTNMGRDVVTESLSEPDRSLVGGFRTARPGDGGGRVRVTANGHVITNRQEKNGTWVSIYVGWTDPRAWKNWDKWIEKERT
jgi:hypothetical protein